MTNKANALHAVTLECLYLCVCSPIVQRANKRAQHSEQNNARNRRQHSHLNLNF